MANLRYKDSKHSDESDSSKKKVNLNNYKGLYFTETYEKYTDPVSGCHFQYDDLYYRLELVHAERKRKAKDLGQWSPASSATSSDSE